MWIILCLCGATLGIAQVVDQIQGADLDFAASFLKPEGQLAGTLEVLEQNLITAVDEGNMNSRFLDSELDSTVKGLSTDVQATLRLEIQRVQTELDETTERLREVQNAAQDGSDPCSVYPGCESCTYDLSCVWCHTTRTCLQGDARGPLTAYCLSYDYNYCSLVGCSRFVTCASCTATAGCGWCGESRSCKPGNQYDSGDCEPTLWLSGNRAICPASGTVGLPVAVDSARMSLEAEDRRQEAEEDIVELQNRVIALQSELLDLTESLSKLIAGVGENGDKPGTSTVNPQIFYLGDLVDSKAKSAQENMLQQAKTEGLKAAKTAGGAAIAAAASSNNQRIAAEEAAMNSVKKGLENTAAKNSELYEQLMSLIVANEELLKTLQKTEETDVSSAEEEAVEVPSEPSAKPASKSAPKAEPEPEPSP